MTYFNETCDPVDLTQCPGSRHYFDPCDCSKFYHCDPTGKQMFSQSCKPKQIFLPESVCGQPNNKICDPESPWKRCNVTESRLNELRLMCENKLTTIAPPSADYSNSQLMPILLPAALFATIVFVLVIVVWNRYRREIAAPLAETDDPHYSSIQEDNPYSIIREQMVCTPHNSIRSAPLRGYAERETNNRTIQRVNRQGEEMVSIETSSYVYVLGSCSTMPPSSNAGRESADRTTQSVNTQDEESVSSDSSSYLYLRLSGSTMPPSNDDDWVSADRTIPSVMTQDEEVVSNEDISYVYDPRSGLTDYPSMGSKSPWPHKIIFSIQKMYLPFPGARLPSTTF